MEQLLIAARLACAEYSRVAQLAHVAHKIDAFLRRDSSCQWALESASKCGLVSLLDRLLIHEWPGFNRQCREWRFRKGVQSAVQYGYDMRGLLWWLQTYWPDHKKEDTMAAICRTAIQYSRLRILQWIYQELQDQLPSFKEAVVCSDLEIVCWLYDHGGRQLPVLIDESSADDVAAFELIKWCTAHPDAFTFLGGQSSFNYAAMQGQLERLQWLHSNRSELCAPNILRGVLFNGQLKVAKWLHDKYPKHYFIDLCIYIDNPPMDLLDVEAVRWTISGFDWKHKHSELFWVNTIRKFAAARGKLETLELVYGIQNENIISQATGEGNRQHLTLSYEIMDAAAANGHLHIVRWLEDHEAQGCTTKAMNGTAANGLLHAVQWLHQHRREGCTLRAIDQAAAGGHLEVIQWLHDNRDEGCTSDAMDKAAANGHLKVVQWLHENRPEGCTTDAMDDAAANGHIDVVQWLDQNRIEGCTTQAMDSAAWHGHVNVLEYLHAHRHEGCTIAALTDAASHGQLEAVKWLHKNRSEGCSADTQRFALCWGHYHVLEYMARHTTYFSLGLMIDSLIDLGQFGTVESILRDSSLKSIPIGSKYVDCI